MLVPVGLRHLTSMTGSIWRAVRCEFCACEFAYRLTRRGSGLATSPLFLDNQGASARSSARAKRDLVRNLENPRTVDPVPCPDCGRYQSLMVRKLRQDSWKALTIFGWLMLTTALFAFFISLTLQHNPLTDRVFLVALVLGFLCFGIRRTHASRLDPNAYPHPVGSLEAEEGGAIRRHELELFSASERAEGRDFPLPQWP